MLIRILSMSPEAMEIAIKLRFVSEGRTFYESWNANSLGPCARACLEDAK
jgi:hypothetical protein